MALSEQTSSTPASENFADLLDESLGSGGRLEGAVLKGTIVSIDGDAAMVDVGLKAEGRIPLKEFEKAGEAEALSVGATVEVFLERMENKNGEVALSREKARREEAWTQLEKQYEAN
ncbi:MAG: S1 RNA-binding domain-containing protein, partial [Pseudomonadota bacterium]